MIFTCICIGAFIFIVLYGAGIFDTKLPPVEGRVASVSAEISKGAVQSSARRAVRGVDPRMYHITVEYEKDGRMITARSVQHYQEPGFFPGDRVTVRPRAKDPGEVYIIR